MTLTMMSTQENAKGNQLMKYRAKLPKRVCLMLLMKTHLKNLWIPQRALQLAQRPEHHKNHQLLLMWLRAPQPSVRVQSQMQRLLLEKKALSRNLRIAVDQVESANDLKERRSHLHRQHHLLVPQLPQDLEEQQQQRQENASSQSTTFLPKILFVHHLNALNLKS
jgi:hypothetical protein